MTFDYDLQSLSIDDLLNERDRTQAELVKRFAAYGSSIRPVAIPPEERACRREVAKAVRGAATAVIGTKKRGRPSRYTDEERKAAARAYNTKYVAARRREAKEAALATIKSSV